MSKGMCVRGHKLAAGEQTRPNGTCEACVRDLRNYSRASIQNKVRAWDKAILLFALAYGTEAATQKYGVEPSTIQHLISHRVEIERS